ncbi:hypothetical protein EOW77_0001395 [Bradyrhizobium yuanmingense]|nr:hypothetical protein EOW77_0001395 [Bradyrhizobium yuanmingense]
MCCRTNWRTAGLLFAPTQRSASRFAVRTGSELHGAPDDPMSDAQIGLMTATPIIIAFAIALRRMGVLSTVGTVSAVGLSIGIATVLFTTQSPLQ